MRRVPRQRGEVEVVGRRREVHLDAGREPVAVPAHVPALHEHAVEAVIGGEVDVAARVLGRGAVVRPTAPRPLAQVHGPPDADVLARPGVRHVAQGVGRVEVERRVVGDEVGRFVADHEQTPRRDVRGLGVDRDAGAPGRQVGLQRVAAGPLERHAGVVDERGLVDGDDRPPLPLHRHRRVHEVGASRERHPLVEVLVAVLLLGADEPRRRVARDRELGQLVDDLEGAQSVLLGPLVAEADRVVEHADDEVHPPPVVVQPEPQFVVVVADRLGLAPRLRPRLVDLLAGGLHQRGGGAQRVAIAQHYAQARRAEDRLPVAGDVVAEVAVGVDGDDGAPVGRVDGVGLGHGAGGEGRQRGECEQSRHGQPAAVATGNPSAASCWRSASGDVKRTAWKPSRRAASTLAAVSSIKTVSAGTRPKSSARWW